MILLPDNNYGPDGLLTGTIPTEIGLLTRLAFLYLRKSIERFNRVDWGFFIIMLKLTWSLAIFVVPAHTRSPEKNDLNGSIPSEVGLLTGLDRLYLICELLDHFRHVVFHES
jgi:hypothetical protein